MAEIVNLRSRRKAKARTEKEALAEQNRRHFGRSRSERDLVEKAHKIESRHLDGHRLTDRQDPDPDAT